MVHNVWRCARWRGGRGLSAPFADTARQTDQETEAAIFSTCSIRASSRWTGEIKEHGPIRQRQARLDEHGVRGLRSTACSTARFGPHMLVGAAVRDRRWPVFEHSDGRLPHVVRRHLLPGHSALAGSWSNSQAESAALATTRRVALENPWHSRGDPWHRHCPD